MANEITPTALAQRFMCGKEYKNLMVIKFDGPNGAKAVAYCCNMNLDFDGDPQAYAALSPPKPTIRPLDNLGNAGFLFEGDNDKLRREFENAKSRIADLEKLKAASTKPEENKAFQDQIDNLNRTVNQYDDYKRAKNYGTIFWKWYALANLSPAEANSEVYHGDPGAPRRPQLDKTALYEDVYGKFPVVQSEFEPGPGYFVTTMPRARNAQFKPWDQRFYLPPGETKQGPYGALTVPYPGYPALGSLGGLTGLALGDNIFAMRLDKASELTFSFRDAGYGPKVGECSIDAYVGLGGTIDNTKQGMGKYDNSFRVLYLAFPSGQTPQTVLTSFAQASNALDFAVILSYLAQATGEAPVGSDQESRKHGTRIISRNSMADYKQWQKDQIKPGYFGHIANALGRAGFKPPNFGFYAPGPGTIPVP